MRNLRFCSADRQTDDGLQVWTGSRRSRGCQRRRSSAARLASMPRSLTAANSNPTANGEVYAAEVMSAFLQPPFEEACAYLCFLLSSSAHTRDLDGVASSQPHWSGYLDGSAAGGWYPFEEPSYELHDASFDPCEGSFAVVQDAPVGAQFSLVGSSRP